MHFQMHFDSANGMPLIRSSPLPEPILTLLTNSCMRHLTCVPLTTFRSNSKSNFEMFLLMTNQVTTKFCARYGSNTVVTYAKFRRQRLSTFYTRAQKTLIKFQIRSQYRDGRQVWMAQSLNIAISLYQELNTLQWKYSQSRSDIDI